jgi:hypothetical protein
VGRLLSALPDMSPQLRKAADHAFVIPTDTPQFFTSTVTTAAFLETLMAFVIATAGSYVIPNIDKFHQRSHDLGIYWDQGK